MRKFLDIAAFTAKAEGRDTAKVIENGNSAPGKQFCASTGEKNRELQNEGCTARKGSFGTQMFWGNGRGAALDEVTAHKDDSCVCTCLSECLFYMILMSVVKWIIFCNDTDCFHTFN